MQRNPNSLNVRGIVKMKNILKLVLGLFLTTTAFAEVSEMDKAKIRGAGVQLLINPGFEASKTDWTMSGSGAFAIVNSGANLLSGKGSATFDAAAASDYIQSSLYTIPNGLLGRNCYVEMLYLGGATTYSLQVLDGSSNVLVSTALSAVTNPTKTYANFICPTSGSIRVRVTASANSAIVALDNFIFGEAVNVVDAIPYFDYTSYTPTGTWTTNVTYTGRYKRIGDMAHFRFRAIVTSSGSTGTFTLNLPSGMTINTSKLAATTDANQHLGTATVVDAASGNYNGYVTYSSTTAVKVRFLKNFAGVQYYSDVDGGDPFGTLASNDGVYGEFSVPITEWSTAQQSIRPDLQFWKVDSSISGANPSLTTGNVASYSEIASSSLTLTNNSGQGNIAAQIPCSATNPPTGTTCAAGSESVGVAFTPTGTFPQEVLACVNFSWSAITGTTLGNFISTIFQVVETPTNAQTLSQEGKSKLESFASSPTAASHQLGVGQRVCGNFTFTSGGQKVLRLMFEQNVTGTPSQSVLLADLAANNGQRDIHWEVYPINQGIPAPILVGSVVSDSVNVKAGGDLGVTSMASGTYTPSLTNTTNIDASTAYPWQYIRFGKQVVFSGKMDIDPTSAASTASVIKISLPIAADFTGNSQASGTCVGDVASGTQLHSGYMFSGSSTDTLDLQFNSITTSSREFRCSGMYTIP